MGTNTGSSTLTALSAMDTTAGLIEQTAVATFAKRALGVAASTSIPTRADADARYAPLSRNVVLTIIAFGFTTDIATGDGAGYVVVPSAINGMNLVRVHARVITAGTTGTTDIQIANVTDSVDMLSTKLTIDSAETGSDTAATPAVIDLTKDDVVTNDLLRIDVDAVSTTPPKGLLLTLEFA